MAVLSGGKRIERKHSHGSRSRINIGGEEVPLRTARNLFKRPMDVVNDQFEVRVVYIWGKCIRPP